MTDTTDFKLAELSIRMFVHPETFSELYDAVHEMLNVKFGESAWETSERHDLTDDPEHRDVLERLSLEAERSFNAPITGDARSEYDPMVPLHQSLVVLSDAVGHKAAFSPLGLPEVMSSRRRSSPCPVYMDKRRKG